MVAVPEFAGGAMENYGLIIYLVLRDDLQSTAARMQRVGYVLNEILASLLIFWDTEKGFYSMSVNLDGEQDVSPLLSIFLLSAIDV